MVQIYKHLNHQPEFFFCFSICFSNYITWYTALHYLFLYCLWKGEWDMLSVSPLRFFLPHSCVDIKTVNKAGLILFFFQWMYLQLLEVIEWFANRTNCTENFAPMEFEFIWDILWDFWAWFSVGGLLKHFFLRLDFVAWLLVLRSGAASSV